ASKKRKRHLDARALKRLRARVKESRQELRALARRSKRLERRSKRLEKLGRSRWWRMRPRLPARRRPPHYVGSAEGDDPGQAQGGDPRPAGQGDRARPARPRL